MGFDYNPFLGCLCAVSEKSTGSEPIGILFNSLKT